MKCTCVECKKSLYPYPFDDDKLLKAWTKGVILAQCQDSMLLVSIEEIILKDKIEKHETFIPETIKIYISYHKKDEPYKEQLEKQLKLIENRLSFDLNHIEYWDRSRAKAGEEILNIVNHKLSSARLYIILLSIDYINNEDCQTELDFGLKESEDFIDDTFNGNSKILGIMVRPFALDIFIKGIRRTFKIRDILIPKKGSISQHKKPETEWKKISITIMDSILFLFNHDHLERELRSQSNIQEKELELELEDLEMEENIEPW